MSQVVHPSYSIGWVQLNVYNSVVVCNCSSNFLSSRKTFTYHCVQALFLQTWVPITKTCLLDWRTSCWTSYVPLSLCAVACSTLSVKTFKRYWCHSLRWWKKFVVSFSDYKLTVFTLNPCCTLSVKVSTGDFLNNDDDYFELGLVSVSDCNRNYLL